jgi:hypothetical protein
MVDSNTYPKSMKRFRGGRDQEISNAPNCSAGEVPWKDHDGDLKEDDADDPLSVDIAVRKMMALVAYVE